MTADEGRTRQGRYIEEYAGAAAAPSHTDARAVVTRVSREGGAGVHANKEVSHQTHLTELRNRPLPAAREGRCITGSTLPPTHREVMDSELSVGIIGFS